MATAKKRSLKRKSDPLAKIGGGALPPRSMRRDQRAHDARINQVIKESVRAIAKAAGMNLQTDADDRVKETARKWQRNYAIVNTSLATARRLVDKAIAEANQTACTSALVDLLERLKAVVRDPKLRR
jgi:hypothetical protein